MKYSAAYRSLLETITVLFLTLVLDDNVFGILITGFYPIYFVANLIFSSATVDFAGGRKKTVLTNAILMVALMVVMLFALMQKTTFHGLYFVLAGLTAIESVAFVFCESITNSGFLCLMLVPRVLFAMGVGVLFVLGLHINLEVTIQMLFARDFIIFLIGAIVLISFRRDFSFKFSFLNLKFGEIIYLVTSNSNDFLMRIFLGNLLGGGS